MFRIRKVPDDTTPANRQAIEQSQAILSEQFSGMPDEEISKLPDQLPDPMKSKGAPFSMVSGVLRAGSSR